MTIIGVAGFDASRFFAKNKGAKMRPTYSAVYAGVMDK
jgi:hypothetical protein